MGRKRQGPVQLSGSTWYARLHVPLALRPVVQKTRLIKSLGTSNHSEALRRYSAAIKQLEQELVVLSQGETLSKMVDILRCDDNDLSDYEKATIALNTRELDETNATHLSVFEAIVQNKPLTPTWQHLLDAWIKDRNRTKARDLAESTLKSARLAVSLIEPLGLPKDLQKRDVRGWVDNQSCSATTTTQRFRLLSSIYQTALDLDLLEGSNPFNNVRVRAETREENKRRSFTDDELIILKANDSFLFDLVCVGMRPGEYSSRRNEDFDGDCILVRDNPALKWRTKTISSKRRVPVPSWFRLMPERMPRTNQIALQRQCRELLGDDLRISPHSARHTHIELARRCGADNLVVAELVGHGKATMGSRYGQYPDDVLKREASKIWDLIDCITR